MPKLTCAIARSLGLMYAGTRYSQKQADEWCPDEMIVLSSLKGSTKEIDAFLDSIRIFMIRENWYCSTGFVERHVSSMKLITPVNIGTSIKEHPLMHETLVPLASALKHPSIRKSYSTMRNYALKGVRRMRDGVTIRLETIVMPDGTNTSVEAYFRFLSSIQ